MRGQVNPQAKLSSYFSPESRVQVDHPLRPIKAYADKVLTTMDAEFERLCAESSGRPSIAPERLLKGSFLIALYSVRSDPDVVRNARLQHPVSMVSGHESGGMGAGPI